MPVISRHVSHFFSARCKHLHIDRLAPCTKRKRLVDRLIECLFALKIIPNKAVNHLGLVVDVNLHVQEGKHFIEIIKEYSSTYIFLRVYDDRLHLWNPGTLPEELTIEELKKDHSSYPRNRNIANVFFKAGYIESWGRGTNKIIDTCKEAGLPEPIIEEEQGGISITFLKDIYTEEYLGTLDINDRQVGAIIHVKKAGKINSKKYQELFNLIDS